MKKCLLNIMATACALLSMIASAQSDTAYCQTQAKKGDTYFLITPIGTMPTSVAPDSPVIATYKVTNTFSSYTLESNGLLFAPQGQTPQGVIQLTDPGDCADPFTLEPGASCTLVLEVPFAAMGGPEVCNTKNCPVRCSIPDPNDQLNVHSAPAIAVGQNLSTDTPLLAQTTNVGVSWKYITVSGAAAAGGQFNAASCTPDLCVAAGMDGNSAPLLAQSIDNGVTWQVVSLLGSPPTSGIFHSVSCSDDFCVAVGEDDSNVNVVPLIAQNTGTGGTWTTVPLPSAVIFADAILSSVSCSEGSLCVAGGYNNAIGENTQVPLLMQNNGSSGSWEVVAVSGIGADNGSFNSTTCNDAGLCTAVGVTLGFNPSFFFIPLLAQNTAGGGDWETVMVTDAPTAGLFDAVSCSSSICVAAGQNNIAGGTLLAQQDTGGAWAVVDLAITPPAPSAAFSAVSCSANLCIAAGEYNVGGPGLLAQTKNAGSSWSMVEIPGLPANTTLVSASCSGKFCIAAGEYFDSLYTYYSPIIVQTVDGGTKWTIVNLGTPPAEGQFFGASVANNM